MYNFAQEIGGTFYKSIKRYPPQFIEQFTIRNIILGKISGKEIVIFERKNTLRWNRDSLVYPGVAVINGIMYTKKLLPYRMLWELQNRYISPHDIQNILVQDYDRRSIIKSGHFKDKELPFGPLHNALDAQHYLNELEKQGFLKK